MRVKVSPNKEYGGLVDVGPELQNIRFRETSKLVMHILVSVSTTQQMFLDLN